MKKVIEVEYDINDEVYLITDTDQDKWLVTSIIMDSQGVMYGLKCGTKSHNAYDIELSESKQIF